MNEWLMWFERITEDDKEFYIILFDFNGHS